MKLKYKYSLYIWRKIIKILNKKHENIQFWRIHRRETL